MKKALLPVLFAAIFCLSGVAGDLPGWLEGWKVKGDLRLRYESADSDDDAKETRNRFRFRLRMSASKKITDQLGFDMRLASGSGDPTSTNQTFDNSFSGKDWNIDRAQLIYTTGDWKLGGGKVANPLHTTDIIWDSDVNPEGFYQSYQGKNFYATLGEFFVEEESTDSDENLYVIQLGVKGGEGFKYDLSASLYDYTNAYGDEDYKFLDALASLHGALGELPTWVKLHYVKNTTSGIDDNDTAFAIFWGVGGKKPGNWNFELKYAEVEAYSVNVLFADSDFGFGDKEGLVGRIGYQSSKYLGWKLSVFSTDGILAENSGRTMAQLDCAVKF